MWTLAEPEFLIRHLSVRHLARVVADVALQEVPPLRGLRPVHTGLSDMACSAVVSGYRLIQLGIRPPSAWRKRRIYCSAVRCANITRIKAINETLDGISRGVRLFHYVVQFSETLLFSRTRLA